MPRLLCILIKVPDNSSTRGPLTYTYVARVYFAGVVSRGGKLCAPSRGARRERYVCTYTYAGTTYKLNETRNVNYSITARYTRAAAARAIYDGDERRN